MSTQTIQTEIITAMKQLITLNKSLAEIARKKTEIIKVGDIEQFQDLQKNEQKHILAIQKVNRNREQAVTELLPNNESPTITDCLPHLNETNRGKLVKLKDDLVNILGELQQQNDLNQQLIAQSLDFINVNVQMLLPQQQQMNYGPQTDNQQQTETKRLFQSEA